MKENEISGRVSNLPKTTKLVNCGAIQSQANSKTYFLKWNFPHHIHTSTTVKQMAGRQNNEEEANPNWAI